MVYAVRDEVQSAMATGGEQRDAKNGDVLSFPVS